MKTKACKLTARFEFDPAFAGLIAAAPVVVYCQVWEAEDLAKIGRMVSAKVQVDSLAGWTVEAVEGPRFDFGSEGDYVFATADLATSAQVLCDVVYPADRIIRDDAYRVAYEALERMTADELTLLVQQAERRLSRLAAK